MEFKIIVTLLVAAIVIIGVLFYLYDRDAKRAIELYEYLIHNRDEKIDELMHMNVNNMSEYIDTYVEQINEYEELLNKTEKRYDEVMEQLNEMNEHYDEIMDELVKFRKTMIGI